MAKHRSPKPGPSGPSPFWGRGPFRSRFVLAALAFVLAGGLVAWKVFRDGAAEEEHAHEAAARGGVVVQVGAGEEHRHVEVLFERGGVLKLYTLAEDGERVLEVESQRVLAYVRPEGRPEATSVVFRPLPQADDPEGRTSRFIARLTKDLWDKKLAVTVPAMAFSGARVRFSFTLCAGNPGGSSAHEFRAEEEKLHLSPGGRYTAADIKANGSVIASEKYEGAAFTHELTAKPGDRLCPVTLARADRRFAWAVGGRSYFFCCPPCIDEFVQLAKERPAAIRSPEEYMKK